MNCAIYFHPEAYTTSGPKLMGRNAAGESFLQGFLKHSHSNEFWVQVQNPAHSQIFASTVREAGRLESVRAVDKNSLAALSQPGVVYHPGPGIGEHAWQRAAYGHSSWSLCGITHTTSSALAMDAITGFITAPVQSWDALICTSTAVKENVTSLLKAQADYLSERLGTTRLTLPQLPVIPLGIHTEDFAFTDEQKSIARAKVGAGENVLVVLFMGRLSFHAKAHPLAMYQALEIASKSLPYGVKILLIECGWHANDHIAKAYKDAAHKVCPSVQVLTLDGRKSEYRQIAWASADIFCSLSDNIQETFGITPIEAMAAALPVVVSDWNGYKDTVRDGVDGFRITTIMPDTGLGGDLALRHALAIDTYDMYCGHCCSFTAVDVYATAAAFEKLFASSDLRKKMGAAGQIRAKQVYDWSVIIPQYEALWTNLSEIRKIHSSSCKSIPYPYPSRMDPLHTFEGYPTTVLKPETILCLANDDDLENQSLKNRNLQNDNLQNQKLEKAIQRLVEYQKLSMVNFAKSILPTEEELNIVLNSAASGPRPAVDLVKGIDAQRQPFVFRALVWLIKLGIIKIHCNSKPIY